MRLWLFIIAALFVQEIASTNVVLLAASQAQYNQFIIHGIFIVASLFDLWVGYSFGLYVRRKYKHRKIVARAEKLAKLIEKHMGNWGERLVLILLGTVSYIYVNAFLVAWIGKNKREALALIFFGDMLWYSLEWLLVLGVRSINASFTVELVALLGISVVVIIAVRLVAMFTKSGGGRD